MANFSSDQLMEIKSRINLAELIESYGLAVRRTGSSAKVCCPFHKEKTPSFHINLERNIYKCFGCGESGDALSFVQKYEGLTFIDALKKLADQAGVKLQSNHYDPEAKLRERLYQIHEELASFYQRCLEQTKEGQIARDYLQQRELHGDIVKQFRIGYAPEQPNALLRWAEKHNFTPEELVKAGVLAPPRYAKGDYYDRFRGRLVFPICDIQGRIIAFSCRLLKDRKNTGKYVNSPETVIFKKSTTLYALNHARSNIVKSLPRRALVCEGQIDVIRCHACGFTTAIASQGTAFTDEHVSIVKRYADTADLLFDGDKAGVKAALRTLGLFLAQGIPVRIATLPEGEDPDSLLRTKGVAALREYLDKAIDPAPYLVAKLSEQEVNPTAMDATMRIARTAILSIVDCPEPILTAKFLKDLSDILGLPLSVFEEDLNHLREDAIETNQRREAFQQRQHADIPQVEHPSTQDENNFLDTSIEEDDDGNFPTFPIDEGEDFIETSITSVDDDSLTSINQSPRSFDITADQNLNDALCELLVHYFTDTAVMTCLVQHLPPSFVHHPYTAKLYDLAIEATLAKRANLSPSRDDQAFVDFLTHCFAMPDRILANNDDITPLAFAQDLIKKFWLSEFILREQRLDPNSDAAFEMALSRKRLQSLPWENAAPFMNALDPKLSAPAPEILAPTTPPTRKDPQPLALEDSHVPPTTQTTQEDLQSPLSEDDILEDVPYENFDIYAIL